MAKKRRKAVTPAPVVQATGNPVSAVAAFGLVLAEFVRFVCELGDHLYPGMNVAPPYRTYDERRPKGWPASKTLCRVAGQAQNAAGWNRFCLVVTGRAVVSLAVAAVRTWEKRKGGQLIDIALSDLERVGVRRRDDRGDRVRRSPTARRVAYRASYREDRFGAMMIWRPLIEWRPLAGGGWGYVQTGAYSVWQLI